MAYKTYTADGVEINLHDLQDKAPWCETGASYEQVFIKKYPNLGLEINPEKSTNIYAPDLLISGTKNLADLKTQNTPFFLAQSRYGIDPQFAVTFNDKDYQRYTKNYPGIEIFFWVDWQAVKFSGSSEVTVIPMQGVWKITYENLLIAVSNAPLHKYLQRVNDIKGNAKDSYVLNLNSVYFNKVV